MPIKKTNLDPDVKSKLRRVVLEEIGDEPKTFSAIGGFKPTAKVKKQLAVQATKSESQPKEEAVEFKPLAVKPKKTAKKSKKQTIKKSKTKTKAKKQPAIPVEIESEPVLEMDEKSKFGGFYGSDAKRTEYRPAWEKIKKEDKSLEDFFKKSKVAAKPDKPGIFSRLFKKKSASPIEIPIAPAVSKPASKGWLGMIVKILFLLVLLALLLLAFDVAGIYFLGFKDDLSVQTAKYLNLPVGQVNKQFISASLYLDDLKTLAPSFAQQREGLTDYSDSSEIKDKVFYRLAANQLVKNKLIDYNKSVSSQEADNQIEALIKQVGDRNQAEKMVKDLYGLDLEQFKTKIILPVMERENLQIAIIADPQLPINLEAQKIAEGILKQAQSSSTDFATLAQKYTQDESGVNTGGDLGWVVRGQLDKQWEDMIFKASSSTVLPQLVKSGFGYHIIRVEQKLVDKDTKQESVKLKHILIRVNVDSYIKSLLDSASLIKYIK